MVARKVCDSANEKTGEMKVSRPEPGGGVSYC